jgi:protein-tyrosine phosphatase
MGNICRSPTAEEVLRVHAQRAGLELHLDSAGTENYHVGEPPDERSVIHAQRRGYDLSSLRARQVGPDDFRDFDLLLAADALNLGVLRDRCPPAYHHKLALFLGDRTLPDPYYGQASDFEKVLDLVEKRAVSLIAEWQAETD